jgi:hypothetical protein
VSVRTQARSAVRNPAVDRVLRVLARSGYVASGLIHLLLGYLAVRVALHQGGRSDQSGAIQEIGRLPGGPVLLWVITVGLFGLGLWLILAAVFAVGVGDAKRWVKTVELAAKAAAYIALGATALTFALGSSSDSRSSTQQASADVLGLPGGQLLLGLIGLVAIGVGGYMVAKGARRGFRKDLRIPSGRAGTAVTVLGVVGYVAKGVAVAVVGVLFVIAAVTFDPEKATGLDGALKSLVSLPFGAVLLVAVGVGLIAFGVYTFFRARYARL